MKKHFLSLITICVIALSFTGCELLALMGLANEIEKYNDEVTNYSVTIEWADGKAGASYAGVHEYGEPVTLKVNATTKTGDISYQWYSFNASDSYTSAKAISGATKNTYTVPNTAELDKNYYCRATNKSETKYYDDTNYINVKFTMFRTYSYATIDEVTTWESKYTYLIKGWLNINKKLNIPAGTVVKFLNGAEINTEDQGLLSAAGTEENPVIFTSYRDDTAGYKYIDSTSNPDAGDWDFIKIKGATGSAFEYCDFRYGKNALILKSKATVKNCTFRDNKSGEKEGALQNDTLDSTIEDCIFYRNDCPLSCEPGYIVSTTNVFHKDDDLNNCQYIKLYAYRNFDGGNWSVSELPYMLEGYTDVNEGKKLTIGSGVICKFLNGASLTIKEGATHEFADDCLFTSYRDDENGGDSDGDNGDPYTGDWKGIKDDNLGKWLTGDNILHAELHN